MPVKATTTAAIKSALAALESGREHEIDVGDPAGLRLRVSKKGVASWTLKYRAGVAQRRVTLGRWPAMGLAAARTEARKVLGRVASGDDPSAERKGEIATRKGLTFGDVASQWTSGELAKRYPDHVRGKRTAADDKRLVELYMKPIVKVPVATLTLDHAETVMAKLPGHLSASSRRHVAQVIGRVMALSVWPLRLREHTPIPKGWKPKPSASKAKSYLFPAEEAALIACAAVPLVRRVAYALLAREGMRRGELLGLTWGDIDSAHGAIHLDTNKTNDPRSWALSADVLAALERWQKIGDDAERIVPLFELRSDDLRADLEAAGVKRPQLFERSENRQPIRVHDLRATFVTLALATGRTETWVADRTGHRSSAMIARYRRAARTAAELGLSWLAPMHESIPELAQRDGKPDNVVNLDDRRTTA